MTHLSKIEIVGIVGRADVKEYEMCKMCRFSVAVNDMYTGNYGSVARVTWFNCVWWPKKEDEGKLEQICKGAEVHLEGRMVGHEYTDQDGKMRVCYEVKVQKVW